MNIYELNPHIRYARLHQSLVGISKDVRICYDCRMFFFDNVSGTILINDEAHDIYNKSAIFLPPETRYVFNIQFKDNAKAAVIDFDLTTEFAEIKSSLGTATEKTFDQTLVPAYDLPEELSACIVRTLPQLGPPLFQCADNFLQQYPLYREKSSALLKMCLLEMVQANQQNSRSEICEAVLGYVHKHFAEPTLANQEIALNFGYHPEHLSKLIRQETGKTLHQYIIHYRIQVAKNYLVTTKYDISEIAWRCGFCSAAYFIKIFRQHTDKTPRMYRLQKIHTEL